LFGSLENKSQKTSQEEPAKVRRHPKGRILKTRGKGKKKPEFSFYPWVRIQPTSCAHVKKVLRFVRGNMLIPGRRKKKGGVRQGHRPEVNPAGGEQRKVVILYKRRKG